MNTRQTHRRLYSAKEMADARQAWDDADLCDQEKREWKEWRHIAAMEGGIIVPPQGTRWDSWMADDPSERAIVCRAMREDPVLLLEAIREPGPASWSKVIAIIYRRWGIRRSDSDRAESWEREHRRSSEADREQATESVKALFARLAGATMSATRNDEAGRE